MEILTGALAQSWPPFVLLLGLLLIGHGAAREGLFAYVGGRLAALPGGGVTLFCSMMALVALVTATLNLDTSVVFLTPLLLAAARRRGLAERPFLYGVIFMSNAASLLLLGSNLTNILVFDGQPVAGAAFAARMLGPWLAAVTLTTLVVLWWCRRELRQLAALSRDAAAGRPPFGPAFVALLGAVIVMLATSNPALPVLGLGGALELLESGLRRRHSWRDAAAAANPGLLSAVFLVAVGIGSLARAWGGPAHLLAGADAPVTTVLGAAGSLLLNNLPAAALLAARRPPHPYALLLGLDLGPNFVVTGALSSLLWLRVSRAAGARPSVRTFSAVGAFVSMLTLGAAIGVSR